MRYIECQADEASILNLLAAGYYPFGAANYFIEYQRQNPSSTTPSLDYQSHPPASIRPFISEDFLLANNNSLPSLEDINNNPDQYPGYPLFANNIEQFQSFHAEYLEDSDTNSTRLNLSQTSDEGHTYYHPLTASDIARALSERINQDNTTRQQTPAAGSKQEECQLYEGVYKDLTKKSIDLCGDD